MARPLQWHEFWSFYAERADLAEIVLACVPQMQKIRFVSSGTEATMSAIRLARAYTKRKYSSSLKAAITATPIRCW